MEELRLPRAVVQAESFQLQILESLLEQAQPPGKLKYT